MAPQQPSNLTLETGNNQPLEQPQQQTLEQILWNTHRTLQYQPLPQTRRSHQRDIRHNRTKGHKFFRVANGRNCFHWGVHVAGCEVAAFTFFTTLVWSFVTISDSPAVHQNMIKSATCTPHKINNNYVWLFGNPKEGMENYSV